MEEGGLETRGKVLYFRATIANVSTQNIHFLVLCIKKHLILR